MIYLSAAIIGALTGILSRRIANGAIKGTDKKFLSGYARAFVCKLFFVAVFFALALASAKNTTAVFATSILILAQTISFILAKNGHKQTF